MAADVIAALVLAFVLEYDLPLGSAIDTRVAPIPGELRTAQPPELPTRDRGPSAAPAPARVGTASTYGPGYTGLLALPEGRGHRVRICGPARCVVRTSNDAGPSRKMQRRGRIADLDVPTFERVCGCSWTRGLVPVTVEYLR